MRVQRSCLPPRPDCGVPSRSRAPCSPWPACSSAGPKWPAPMCDRWCSRRRTSCPTARWCRCGGPASPCPGAPSASTSARRAPPRADCVQAGSANGRPRQADGTGSFLFRVKAGESLPEFPCNVTTPCSIGVFEVNPTDSVLDFAAAVITTVKFAPTADSCPSGLTKSLTGVVASGSFRASLSWAAIACQGSTALDLNPTLGSSPDAKLAFLGVTSTSPSPATRSAPTTCSGRPRAWPAPRCRNGRTPTRRRPRAASPSSTTSATSSPASRSST